MKDIHQAARELRIHLGRPSWLSSIGVGSQDEHPAIILFLVCQPKVGNPIPSEWDGYPVIAREFGSLAPLG
jgi:hypothetical protein